MTLRGICNALFLLAVAAFLPLAGFAADSADSGEFAYFPIRGAAQGFKWHKKLTDEPGLIEQARQMLDIGCDAFKTMVGPDVGGKGYRDVYPDMPELPREKKNSMVRLVQNTPTYQEFFDLPFKFFVIWAWPTNDITFSWDWEQATFDEEYQQLYDFTRYLMETYQGTGKVFLLGNWETDHVLMSGLDQVADPKVQPSQERLEYLRRWLNNRQKAVEDGRNSLPEIEGVEVYHYVEVITIQPVIEDPTLMRVVNGVLPYIRMDLVSNSAYNSTNHTSDLPQRVYDHMDCILKYAEKSLTGAWPYGPPVFISEFGIPGGYTPQKGARNREALKACAGWGSVINLFWEVYSQTPDNTDSALFQSDGTPNGNYEMLRDFNFRMHTLKNARRVWCRRNPTEQEANNQARLYDTLTNADILRDSINLSSEIMSDEEFLKTLFTDLRLGDQIGQSWYQELLAKLARADLQYGYNTRYGTLGAVLDSDLFAAAVPQEEFAAYLTRRVINQPVELPDLGRRDLYEWALNHPGFDRGNLEYRLANNVPESLRDKYSLKLQQFQEGSEHENH
ncbi:MAG: hypothetical protein BWZ08_01377 [candidate division BRC1 bacterium ADurb.BinA292]|nr:MAG: hypothetical protein BWZ08_01377 [candidate division BRC1 bacterium ADurb.BinA292]